MNDLSRLRWRCRRGTREMDILLESFLDRYYGDLSESERKSFDRLLDESDADIFDWIRGRTSPGNTEYCGIIRSLQTLVKQ